MPADELTSEAVSVDDERLITVDELRARRRDRPISELPRLVKSAIGLVNAAARRELRVVLVVSLVGGLLTGAQLLVLRELLTSLIAKGDFSTVGTRLVLFVLLFTTSSVAAAVASERQRVLGEMVQRHTQVLISKSTAAATLLDFDRPQFHNRLERTLGSLGSRPVQIVNGVVGLVGSLATLVGVCVAIATVEPLVLVVMLLAVFPLWQGTRAIGRLSFRFEVDEAESDRRRQYVLTLLVRKEAAQELRSLGLGPLMRDRLHLLWSARLERVKVLSRRRLVLACVGRVASGVMLGAVVLILFWMYDRGRISLAEMAATATGVIALGASLQALISSIGSLYESSLFMGDAAAFIADFDVVENLTIGPSPAFESLELRNVSFRYPASKGDVLSGVNLTIGAGEIVAVVGLNGSGKTTLAKVAAQLFTPMSGEVRINGAVVGAPASEQARENIAVLFQDFLRFFYSARENIHFGRVQVEPSEGRITGAAVAAGIDQQLRNLPDGYDTLLGPQFYGGTDLSGGQWQRLALARAFFRDAPVLVLDEPTSALDAQAEHDLFRDLRRLFAGRAVLLISHRFSTVTSADRVVVMDKGRIVEEGTHSELLGMHGIYERLFRLQAAGYQMDAP